jgi:hypothetical protein
MPAMRESLPAIQPAPHAAGLSRALAVERYDFQKGNQPPHGVVLLPLGRAAQKFKTRDRRRCEPPASGMIGDFLEVSSTA